MNIAPYKKNFQPITILKPIQFTTKSKEKSTLKKQDLILSNQNLKQKKSYLKQLLKRSFYKNFI
jgi:hypothetical protein